MIDRTYPSPHPFIRRLSALHGLSVAEESAVLELLGPSHQVRRGEDIVADGSVSPSVCLVVDGAACRYKLLSSGQRQILGFVLPGDMADDFGTHAAVIDHGVSASTDCVVERVSRSALQRTMDLIPNLARAIWRYSIVQACVYRSWLAHTRRRSAAERLAHLFCEQFARLQAVGLAEEGRPLPLHLVQSDLADATGMSAIHVNRTLQHLRSRNLIGRNPNHLEILDWGGLRKLAEFDPGYLQLRHAA